MLKRILIHKSLLIGALLALLIFGVIIIISVRQLNRTNDTAKWVAHTLEVLLSKEKLQLSVTDNETNSRAYLLTGLPEFLEKYETSKNNIPEEIDNIRQLTADNSSQQLRIDSFQQYLTQRIILTDSILSVKNTIGVPAAAQLLIFGEPKIYSNRIQEILKNIQEEENQLYALRKNENHSAITTEHNTFLAFIFIILLLLVVLFWKERTKTLYKQQKKSEIMFRDLLDAAPDATVIVDEQGIMQLVNKQAENLFGYTRDEMIGKQVEILIPEGMRHKHNQHRASFNKDPKIRYLGAGIELFARKKDGTIFPVEISLSPIKTSDGQLVSASVRDITERKKSEAQIAHLAKLIEDISEAVFSCDNSFRIKSWNKAAAQLFDFTSEEVIGRHVSEVIQPQKDHEDRMIIRNEIKTAGHWTGEITYLKKDGTHIYTLVSTTVTRNMNDAVEGYVSVCRDISVSKKLEEQLKKSNAELEAFSYSISHDLRAPLRGIIGFTNILEEDYGSKLDNEAKRITSVIKNSALKMGHLIDDLLAFSRMGRQDIVKNNMSMRSLVDELVTEMNAGLVNQNIEWFIQPLPDVNADLSLLRQVWINIISNAIKYSRNAPAPRIEIGSHQEKDETIFHVKDNGVGFNEKYADKLFRVFQRLHSADEFEGTGVGLAIAEKIISKHGGRIWATAEESKGACFYFSLPNE